MSEPARIALIVEDEPQIRRFVRAALEAEQWRVFEAGTLKQGLVEAGTRLPDLVILDLGLPDGDGESYIRELRTWSQIPVIELSARSDEADKVRALDAGADDYLAKPFGISELMARVRANLRRSRSAAADAASVFEFGTVRVDLAARVVTKGAAEVHLTALEYRLLGVLIANAGRVMTHRNLLREVWGPSHTDSSHYLRVYMRNLRHKLEDEPARPRHLITETAVGYRLVAAG